MMGVLTQHLTNTELFTAAIFTVHSACGPPGLENSGTSCRKRTRADVSTSVPSCHKPGGVSPCMKRNVMSTLHSHSIAGRGHAAEYSPRTNRGFMSHRKRNLEPLLGRATQHLQPQAGLHWVKSNNSGCCFSMVAPMLVKEMRRAQAWLWLSILCPAANSLASLCFSLRKPAVS